MIRWKLQCMECNKKESFVDAQDVSQSKWRIIGWNVNTAEPKCVCDKCEYVPVESVKKKRKE